MMTSLLVNMMSSSSLNMMSASSLNMMSSSSLNMSFCTLGRGVWNVTAIIYPRPLRLSIVEKLGGRVTG